MKIGSLNELEAAVAVARRGGFRAAAQELGISSSTLSHAVAALEERLGARLFNRTTRSVVLTQAGEQFIVAVTPALAAIRDAAERVGDHGIVPSGVLRINASLMAARMILEPIILNYLRRYPGMEVELATEGALIDVIGQGFDAGIRIAEAVPPDMIAVPIPMTMRSIVVGSPDYLAKNGVPIAPIDLNDHRCIRARLTSGRRYRWEFERLGQELAIDVPGNLTLDEAGLIEAAARRGEGLAFLPETLIAADQKAGRLVHVLSDWTPSYAGLCLYYPHRRHVPAKLRAMIDLIRELSVDDID